MNKGRVTGPDSLNLKTPERDGKMSQSVRVPERSYNNKAKGELPANEVGNFYKTGGIESGAAIKSTLIYSDGAEKQVNYTDYRRTLEAVKNPEKKAIQEVLSMGANLGAFRAEKAEG